MSMQWYIIHTYSGFEKKVKESLESRVAAFNLQDKIGRVLIPTEDVVEVRGGKKTVASRMSYPGYVLVEMDLDENTWHIVRNTPRVTGFVGSATAPPPLSEAEVDAIINRVHTPIDRPKPKVVFERNEQVRIVDGPFANFNGTVEEIDNDHSRLKVSVTIYTDRTFTFILKTPPASVLLLRAAGIAKGSAEPNRNKVGKVTKKQVEEIAKIKLVDLNTTSLDSAVRTVMGTARNMGLEVVEA